MFMKVNCVHRITVEKLHQNSTSFNRLFDLCILIHVRAPWRPFKMLTWNVERLNGSTHYLHCCCVSLVLPPMHGADRANPRPRLVVQRRHHAAETSPPLRNGGGFESAEFDRKRAYEPNSCLRKQHSPLAVSAPETGRAWRGL